MLTLYQAEWCPYSSRIRQALTEYGIDFVAKQVAAEKRDRDAMRDEIGRDEIPVLVLEDGTLIDDWQQALEHIRTNHERREDADRHREKWFEEAPERDPHHVLT